MSKLGMGLIGPGFIAAQHIDAVRRLGFVDVVAIAGSSKSSAADKARMFHVPKAYGRYEDLIADPDISVVHNTTPNHLHFPITLAALRAGKHVVSDKPLALTAEEGKILRDAAAEAGVVNAVTFNYRGNAMVQQARAMLAKQLFDPIFFIHGVYLQDWMTDPSVYSWRSDPAKGGASSALADIGSHWCDLAQHLTNSRVTHVLADLTTVVPVRYATAGGAESFSTKTAAERIPKTVEGEDLASVLLRFENGAKGVLTVGQVLPGHKNDLQIEVSGRTGSVRWKQEEQNKLWVGRHDQPNYCLTKDASTLDEEVLKYARLPAGHQEGWADAFRNVIEDIYEWIATGVRPVTVSTFADACYVGQIVEAMLRSHREGGRWIEVD